MIERGPIPHPQDLVIRQAFVYSLIMRQPLLFGIEKAVEVATTLYHMAHSEDTGIKIKTQAVIGLSDEDFMKHFQEVFPPKRHIR